MISIALSVTKCNNKNIKNKKNVAKRIDNINIMSYNIITTKRSNKIKKGGRKMAKKRKYPVLDELKGKIRAERKTYRSLSLETGISLNAINDKLNGYSAFDSDEMEAFMEALNISVEEIVKFFLPNLLRNVA